MTRFLLSLVSILFFSTLLQAQAWQPFGVRQFGFTFDVPPGFVLTQRSDQGAAFRGANEAFLAVWGARLGKASFRAEIKHRMVEDEKAGWKLTYRRVTPRWASYSGINNGQIRYVRAIAVCDDRAALFTINYSKSEKVPYDPVVVRMVRSLKAEGC
ncbi:hypothetical protein EN858_00615 [Mesorhizobium sp. M4B.F.Ca.ET.215.01.1.1]|uniref:DUF1795 domain-containing protein n=1 Tax=Mesorhizobium abyssinicae TaxID=1209958 RepID=A0ABU5AMU7_9HYPH|nr:MULTISPECIES: hypothetical protein [Mesorhizobium]MDX8538566.1 hypothetical protein [Mesorhizobium abyssinicae]RUW23194.1 hypothetical protein EOA34_19090 [Mesorhizobium sp. M4B.F.Ca.ET.013.02.1.1]RVD35351.1 hypothetical protein EN741_28055 [Mesorhizobium sp. M4B.F.Ca.ET.019.03.1.1]RWC97994.1 MAG: hypothetical protein EOS32_02050 [Mesorhizobium sp.]RWF64674.1 MAG: hypothetical protein EOS47_13990 [Mesorhizobium sp.]